MKNQDEEALVLRLSLGDYYNDAEIILSENNSFNRDRDDGIKLYSYNNNVPQIYSLSNDNFSLARNYIPEVGINTAIPLGFLAPKDSVYTISIVNTGNSISSNDVYLEDKSLNSWHKLSESSYSFSSENGDFSERFVIHFGVIGISESENTDLPIQVFSHGKTITIINQQQLIGKVVLVNITGQQVAQHELFGEAKQEIVVNAKSGFYLMNIKYAGGNESMKVVIK